MCGHTGGSVVVTSRVPQLRVLTSAAGAGIACPALTAALVELLVQLKPC